MFLRQGAAEGDQAKNKDEYCRNISSGWSPRPNRNRHNETLGELRGGAMEETLRSPTRLRVVYEPLAGSHLDVEEILLAGAMHRATPLSSFSC